MKLYFKGFAAIVLMVLGIANISWKAVRISHNPEHTYHQYVEDLYHEIRLDSTGLNLAVFQKAITGFYNIRSLGMMHTRSILSIADFDQESCKKRFYIIDLDKKELILNTWVAHGENSGGDLPDHFSNRRNSNESSLGFFLTAEVYYGKHGRSLKLDGMDPGFNNNARERAIVLHGAEYVCQETIDQLGRLGRSQGCPAIPAKLANTVITAIADRTVLFIHSSAQAYTSTYLNEELAGNIALGESAVLSASIN